MTATNIGGSEEEVPVASLVAPTKICPRVVIISMFKDEADIWDSAPELLNLDVRRTIPGLSPRHPFVSHSEDGEVCHITTGESLLNAALSLSAFLASPIFDLSRAYFVIAGIAGISPKYGSLGSISIARYAVQVDLQYEFDAREIPADWKTGYLPQGSANPDIYPPIIYGTEVFEVNEDLRQIALKIAESVPLEDSESVRAYREMFSNSPSGIFDAATKPPSVIAGDVASSNVFFHGHKLCEAFENTVKLFTNGAGRYTVTAQEDTATLAALLRSAMSNRIDYSRIVILRSGSNFDQPPIIGSIPPIPLHTGHGGFELALRNLFLVGMKIVRTIRSEWSDRFKNGVKPSNYVGDILGSLGGVPDFGPGRTKD